MRTINETFYTLGGKVLVIGYKGEKAATQVLINCAEILANYHGTTPFLTITKPNGTTYNAPITVENGALRWVVSGMDTRIAGLGSIRVILKKDNDIVVSSSAAGILINKNNKVDGSGESGNAIIDDDAGPGDTDVVWSADKVYTELLRKVEKPAGGNGTSGQVLQTNGDGTTAWVDQSGGAEIDDTAGAGDTDVVWSADKVYSEFDEVRNALKYQPMAIAAFTASPATAELGDTPKAVTLACAFNKTPASVSLDGAEKTASYTGETVSAEDGGTHSKSWTLEASDAGSWADEPHTAQATAKIDWLPKVYYGAAPLGTVNSAFILALTGVLVRNRKRTFTVSAGSGEYIWYASPTNYGACEFSVGGFDGGFEAMYPPISLTNASGYTQSYYVYKSLNANLGSTMVEVK